MHLGHLDLPRRHWQGPTLAFLSFMVINSWHRIKRFCGQVTLGNGGREGVPVSQQNFSCTVHLNSPKDRVLLSNTLLYSAA